MTDRLGAPDPEPALFSDASPRSAVSGPPPRRAARDAKRGTRLREANRDQLAWGRIDLNAQVPDDEPVRSVWALVERLDLSALYVPIEARDDVAGTSAIDPKLLLALWVYATSEGEGSGREIERLTLLHAAYRWLCGGVAVGAHASASERVPNRSDPIRSDPIRSDPIR